MPTYRCSKCANTNITRLRRRWWMRLFKNSKFFQCRDCSQRFLVK